MENRNPKQNLISCSLLVGFVISARKSLYDQVVPGDKLHTVNVSGHSDCIPPQLKIISTFL